MSGIGQRNTVPSSGFDQGEHGAGTGLSGGHGVPGQHNTQSGLAAAAEQAGFNHGLGGQHASGGLPERVGGAGVSGTLDQYSGNNSGGLYGSSGDQSAPKGEAVSGAYEGGAARDGLTGQSGAHTTGEGVGPLGTNVSSTPIADKYSSTGGEHHHHHHSGHHHGAEAAGAGALAAGAGGYAAGSDQRTASGGAYSSGGPPLGAPISGGAGHGQAHDREIGIDPSTASGYGTGQGTTGGQYTSGSDATNTGVGPAGGSGGHYSTSGQQGSGLGAGAAGLGAGAAAGGLAASGLSGRDNGRDSSSQGQSGASAPTDIGSGAGTQKAGEEDPRNFKHVPGPSGNEGAPISDPSELDTGGPHSLVFDKASGKYVHRRELEGNASTGAGTNPTHATSHGTHASSTTRDADRNLLV